MTERIKEQKTVILGPGRWYALGQTGVQVFIQDGPMINMVYRTFETVPEIPKVEKKNVT
jgi:hypothetical protein